MREQGFSRKEVPSRCGWQLRNIFAETNKVSDSGDIILLFSDSQRLIPLFTLG